MNLIKKFHAGCQKLISHQVINSSRSTLVDENTSCYDDPQMINILNEGLCHFVPVLRKTSLPNETSEAKTSQAIDGRYLKECSLTDTSTWSAVAAKKEDADFGILRKRNSPTVSAALDFTRQAGIYATFNQASYIEADNHSGFPSNILE